jgi:hypothetical protein
MSGDASKNGGVYPYPLVQNRTYPNLAAPERAFGERTGDPFIGGSLPTEARIHGVQPGFDYAGIPLSALPVEDYNYRHRW